MILRLVAILTLLSPALVGLGRASKQMGTCCEASVVVATAAENCASSAPDALCESPRDRQHECCTGAAECICGIRQAPEPPQAPKTPLPSRSDHNTAATLYRDPGQTLAEHDVRAARMPQRPVVLVILTALRTNNDALAFLSVWRT